MEDRVVEINLTDLKVLLSMAELADANDLAGTCISDPCPECSALEAASHIIFTAEYAE